MNYTNQVTTYNLNKVVTFVKYIRKTMQQVISVTWLKIRYFKRNIYRFKLEEIELHWLNITRHQ